MAEKISVVMARRNIRMAHVVLLVLDAVEGVSTNDATIAGYAHEGGRALIICVNKWDELKKQFQERVRAATFATCSSFSTTRPSNSFPPRLAPASRRCSR
jgi:predicted GTPase